MFVSTKPSDQRRGKGHSAADIVADLSPKLGSLLFAPNGGLVAMFEPPPSRASAALVAFSSSCRIPAVTPSATSIASPIKL